MPNNLLRAMFGLQSNEPVTHIRQYAREMGVHVFRQKIHSTTDTSQGKLPFHGVCLSGTIGNNKNGRIIIFDSSLPYFVEQFCVAHELGHALLDGDVIWENRPTLRSFRAEQRQCENDKEEQIANAFAWELLSLREYFKSSDNFTKIISDIVGLSKSIDQAIYCPEKIVNQLLRDKKISNLIDQHEGLRDKLHRVAKQELTFEALHDCHYSPALRCMFERLQQGGYTDRDIDRLKDLIDRGLSHHFVEVCERAYDGDSGRKEEITSRCAEVFTVSTLRIEEAFEMYKYLHAKQV